MLPRRNRRSPLRCSACLRVMRVNSAKDDSAGFGDRRAHGRTGASGMNVAVRNANDAISMAQTAEGALGKVGDMLQRMRELAVQSANATNGTSDRANLDAEYHRARPPKIGRTLTATKFNGQAILAADAGAKVVPGRRQRRRDDHRWTTTRHVRQRRHHRRHRRRAWTDAGHGSTAALTGDRHRTRHVERRARALRRDAESLRVGHRRAASRRRRTRPLRRAASPTPTSPPKRPTCRARRSCNRPARR